MRSASITAADPSEPLPEAGVGIRSIVVEPRQWQALEGPELTCPQLDVRSATGLGRRTGSTGATPSGRVRRRVMARALRAVVCLDSVVLPA